MSSKKPTLPEEKPCAKTRTDQNAPLPEPAHKVHFFPGAYRKFLPSVLRYGAFNLSHRARQAIEHENLTGARFQALPVAFGVGAIFYFLLPREPLLPALLTALVLTALLAQKTYGQIIGSLAIVATFIFAGMVAGKIRTDLLDTQMIDRPVQATISGIVLDREMRANKRQRYTIALQTFDSRSRSIIVPEIIRVTAHARYPLVGIGEGITGLVRLRPPSVPAYPGIYDFAFQAWFSGIGGNGFFLGDPKPAGLKSETSFFPWFKVRIAEIRNSIGSRIRETLPGENGNLAAALIVGDRSGISKKTNEALRRSGLAHILAISGLHMALVTATIIFLVRGTLALFPAIALYYPIRKWAAASAMVAATLYLVLSGAGIATQRAWIMIMIMLVAVLIDRRALTMRNVGLAALLVLAWRPESIISPSFQMSFAAVAALIAVYEGWSRYQHNRVHSAPVDRISALALRAFRAVSGLAVTSIVAGVATGLFAAYHFYRVAPLGLLANLAAMPLVSLAVMPLALATMVLMPFGLDTYPLTLMGMAIDKVVVVAEKVAGLDVSGNTGFIPLASLVFGAMALTVLTQLKTMLRALALPLAALAVLFYVREPMPDILVSESGSSIAVLDGEGGFHLLNPRKEKFITSIWRKAFAPESRAAATAYQCDDLGCTFILVSKDVLAMPKRAEAFYEDCRRATIIVTRLAVPEGCTKPALVIGRKKLQEYGSHAVRFVGDTIEVKTAYRSAHRPWSRYRKRQKPLQHGN